MADPDNRVIGELTPELGAISWRLNAVGKAEFSLAQSDTKATEDMLRFGNRILFQFENGLPEWGGVIDPPREWSADGRIQCTAYSAEYILGMRCTAKDRTFDGSPIGTIYRTLIENANGTRPTGIEIGEIWAGGNTYTVSYHYDNILQVVQDLLTVRLNDADFWIEPGLSGGHITFTAHFFQRRGSDRSGAVALLEDWNAIDCSLSEQGPITNVAYIIGAGAEWTDSRLVGDASDTSSVATYGQRETSESHTDLDTETALADIANTLVATYKNPQGVVSVSAVNLAPALFADYDLGDDVRIWLHSYGFNGYNHRARVLAREYDPNTGRCALIVEEHD